TQVVGERVLGDLPSCHGANSVPGRRAYGLGGGLEFGPTGRLEFAWNCNHTTPSLPRQPWGANTSPVDRCGERVGKGSRSRGSGRGSTRPIPQGARRSRGRFAVRVGCHGPKARLAARLFHCCVARLPGEGSRGRTPASPRLLPLGEVAPGS